MTPSKRTDLTPERREDLRDGLNDIAEEYADHGEDEDEAPVESMPEPKAPQSAIQVTAADRERSDRIKKELERPSMNWTKMRNWKRGSGNRWKGGIRIASSAGSRWNQMTRMRADMINSLAQVVAIILNVLSKLLFVGWWVGSSVCFIWSLFIAHAGSGWIAVVLTLFTPPISQTFWAFRIWPSSFSMLCVASVLALFFYALLGALADVVVEKWG